MSIIKLVKGLVSAYIAYPIAEHMEKRDIRAKFAELRHHYQLPFATRKKIAAERLAAIVEYAGANVPYYRDLFQSIQFDSAKLRKDANYINDIPYLTKDIIREQGERLFSQSLPAVRHHARKTGGSTGLSCTLYYDQESLDYTAAIALYVREAIEKYKRRSELHFACRFPDQPPFRDRLREGFKSFAMNRTNVFFDALNEEGLEQIWRAIKKQKPYLVHAHPSTIYSLACYVEKKYHRGTAFKVFESSGELLEKYMRNKIAKVFSCKVVDRYGLAEFGIIAYELKPELQGLLVLDSEGWVESFQETSAAGKPTSEIVFTGFRNELMPLIRYRTGDLGNLQETESGFVLTNMIGRIHDIILINGVPHATHYVQDVLDHKVGGIQEFQMDMRHTPPKLLIVPEAHASRTEITDKLRSWWRDAFEICFVEHKDLIRVGNRAKFRHVVTA